MTRAYVTRKLVLRRDLYGAFLRLRRHEVARRGRGKEREREREIERERPSTSEQCYVSGTIAIRVNKLWSVCHIHEAARVHQLRSTLLSVSCRQERENVVAFPSIQDVNLVQPVTDGSSIIEPTYRCVRRCSDGVASYRLLRNPREKRATMRPSVAIVRHARGLRKRKKKRKRKTMMFGRRAGWAERRDVVDGSRRHREDETRKGG